MTHRDPREGPDLCVTCNFATVAKGRSPRNDIKRCLLLQGILRGPIVECSGYQDSRLVRSCDMEKIALTLENDKNTNKIGFVPPKVKVEDDT